MKRFTVEEIDYIKNNYGKISTKQIALDLNRDYTVVKHKTHKLNLSVSEKGKNNFSRKRRQYDCLDTAFSKSTLVSNYWAGFIAADGYLHSKTGNLGLMLAVKDKDQLLKLKKFLKTEKPIYEGTSKGFGYVSIVICSVKIAEDLQKKFNITPKKSLTLKYPEFKTEKLEDAFIVGYIDGDGSIFKTDISPLTISIEGTQDVLLGIKKRLDTIVGSNSGGIYRHRNHWTYISNTKKTLIIFKWLKKINVPKMKRKWDTV